MKQFFQGFALAVVVLPLSIWFWFLTFDAMDDHAAEYQECGYQFCEPVDPPLTK
jgi:hypothetical protein